MNNTIRNISILLLVMANTGCDQISKTIARQEIGTFEIINVIGDHLVLNRVENTGAFLSIGDEMNGNLKILLLGILPLALLCFGISYLLLNKKLPGLLVLGMSFVIGGGLGNLYDRFSYGSVTDFMHIDFFIFKSGIFNFADVSILTGMIMLLINVYNKHHSAVLEKQY